MAHRTRGRLTALALASLVLAACSSTVDTTQPVPTSSEAPAIRQGGSIVVLADQEPATFNQRTAKGNTAATRDIVRSVLPSVWTINDRFEFELNRDLVTSAEVTSNDPQTIVYRLDPQARWYDKTPVSADDFVYAFEMQQPGATDQFGPVASAVANEDVIRSIAGSDDGKTVTVVLKQPFADWKALFLVPLVPAHKARAVGWNSGFDTADAVQSAGPFRIAGYNRGKDLTLVRNEDYWGTPAKLDSIVFRFVKESSEALVTFEDRTKGREADLITPRVQVDLKEQLAGLPDVRSEPVPSQVYEYLDFNLSNDLLRDPVVRRALAMAVDRREIVARTVGRIDPHATVLNNRLFMSSHGDYLDTSGGRYNASDPGKAQGMLKEAGFTLNAEGIFQKDGKALSFRLTSTSGDELRIAQEQLIQAQVRKAGIELRIANVEPSRLGPTLTAPWSEEKQDQSFDIANVGQNLIVVSSTSGVFGTGGSANVTKYSNPKVDALFAQARAELDAGKGKALYYDIDRILWDDMPRLPLYQRPSFVAYRADLVNVAPSPALGVFWNTARWGLKVK